MPGGSDNLTWDNTSTTLYVNGSINATGDITAYYVPSDSRLKRNVTRITGALAKVQQLDGVTYNWNELAINRSLSIAEAGVIAQQVQAVLPEVIQQRPDGYLGVAYERLASLLIEAVKELKAEVDELKNKIQ